MTKSECIVGFIANLIPLYFPARHGGLYAAQSLEDGTLVLPVPTGEWDDEDGMVRIFWQGDPKSSTDARGEYFATPILDRYVRLHAAGASEDAIHAELWFMAKHFEFKTGGSIYLPHLKPPPHPIVRVGKKAMEFGQGILINLLSP
ncbi:hypothetical protein [Pseudacidovorax intermedius]|uniref:hypothetical protein n=1 Tax=Pseudacidovorax intermedius TaxID=433924 RepID=UPI00034B7EC8|nr:hypothetical protein [Pseudacidovorax intermedius]